MPVYDAGGWNEPIIGNFGWAVVSLSFFAGAFNVEIFRAGIEAVPTATKEAAESLGYTRLKSYMYIVLPLAFRVSLPALNNNLVNLVKTTTLAYVIAVPEMMYTVSVVLCLRGPGRCFGRRHGSLGETHEDPGLWAMKTFVNKRPPIPGIATGSTTDLPVLLPTAGRLAQRAQRDRLEGTWRLELKLWHGVLLVILFLLFAGIAEAQSQAEPDKGPLATLFRWIPVLLWKNGNGFVLNLTISFLAMAIGTVAGMALGLAQVSLLAPVRTGSWFTTQFFRNSPWLVLLFCIMLLFPFEIVLGSTVYKVPDWTKATIGFSLPVMANLSEVVRGAVQSIPTGQWESADLSA
jgi:His/Glu/Gln/Arg/opine family amino acid ABC transporter permease subunit